MGVTQTVFFMVLEETQTSTSSTSVASASVTQCAGGDGPSSVVLDSPGPDRSPSQRIVTRLNASDTHVVHGWNTVTVERQNVK